MRRPTVVIAGGGFAGLACAQALDARHFDVTLVDRRTTLDFIPNIHELISGLKTPRQLTLPLNAILRSCGHRFRRGQVVAIDRARRSLTLADGRELSGDYLVLALGSVDASYGVEGVGKHTLGLKSVAEGRQINQALRQLLRRPQTVRVVVAGSGLAGVEALGEVLRLLPPARREVHLVEAAPRLLPAAPARVSRFLAGECEAQDVTLHLADPVRRVTAKTVFLASGRRLRSDLTLWTGGPAPPTLVASSALAQPGHWIDVAPDLSLPGHPGVYAAGDLAQLSNPLTRQAYHALDMGAAAARNIARVARGRPGRDFRPLPRPTLLAFGERGCILIAGGQALFAPSLCAAKEGIYAAVMAKLDQRDARGRLQAALHRGRGSARQLWPLLRPAELLRGAASAKAL